MEILNVIVGIVCLFALSRAYLRYKDGQVTRKELAFWTAIWTGIFLITLRPEITSYFSDIFGIGRGIDFVIYSSIILLFYLIFRIYVKLESIEQEITKIVREMTYQNLEKEKTKSKK